MRKFLFSSGNNAKSKNRVESKEELSQETFPNTQGGLVSAHSLKGGKTYNEDSWVIFCSEDKTLTANCVFDGHGDLNGRLASMKCAELTWKWFNEDWKSMLTYSDDEWRKVLRDFFLKLHRSIRNLYKENEKRARLKKLASVDNLVDGKGVVRDIMGFPVRGGTTGSVCIVVNTNEKRQCVCANVGDSYALLFPLSQSYFPDQRSNNAHLSTDHGPDSEREYLRIKNLPREQYPIKLLFVYDIVGEKNKYDCPLVFLRHGAKDSKYLINPWQHNLRPTNLRKDPAVYAVTPQGVMKDVTCIAMTRSLGDFYAHPFGLTWEPDVSIRKLRPEMEFLITVASDGVWDCWKFHEFSSVATAAARKYRNRLLKANIDLVKRTLKTAKKMFGKKSYDDITLSLLVVPKNE
jgi:serine/threonine protein phosphatase PrpC